MITTKKTLSKETIKSVLLEEVANRLDINSSEIDCEKSLAMYGFDSLKIAQIQQYVLDKFKVKLSISDLFNNDTINSLSCLVAIKIEEENSVNNNLSYCDNSLKKRFTTDHISLSEQLLEEKIANCELPPLDAASIVTIDDGILLKAGIPLEAFLNLYLQNEVTLISIYKFQNKQIGLYCLPVLSSQIYSQSNILENCILGVQKAIRDGAKYTSLTGLIPSASSYGVEIESLLLEKDISNAITTGHGTTSAAVVLSIHRAMDAAERNLHSENVAFIGLGSIGTSVLKLMLNKLPHPKSLTLCDIFSKSSQLDLLESMLINDLGYKGEIIKSITYGYLDEKIYSNNVFVCATNAENILDLDKVKSGSIIIDDSAPHCFDIDKAKKRLLNKKDILITEGGMIRLPQKLEQLIYWPLPVNNADESESIKSIVARDNFEIMGCMFSGLLPLMDSNVGTTIGEVTLDDSISNYEYLLKTGIQGANLHCSDMVLSNELIESFKNQKNLHLKPTLN